MVICRCTDCLIEESMEHITTLSMRLLSSNAKRFNSIQVASLGPMLQGVLMENIDVRYAEYLHMPTFNPYSQYCILEDDGCLLWNINTLNDEAANQIISSLQRINSVNLRAIDTTFSIERKTTESIPVSHLLDYLKAKDSLKHRFRFITPASFKAHGEYAIMPNTRLIFQNLLMRYNQVYTGDNEIDEATINYIEEHTRISSYNLKSRYFSHTNTERKKIPAFVGDLTLSVLGPQPIQGLVSMLLAFGEYAGVGIKTSMGMGAIKNLLID